MQLLTLMNGASKYENSFFIIFYKHSKTWEHQTRKDNAAMMKKQIPVPDSESSSSRVCSTWSWKRCAAWATSSRCSGRLRTTLLSPGKQFGSKMLLKVDYLMYNLSIIFNGIPKCCWELTFLKGVFTFFDVEHMLNPPVSNTPPLKGFFWGHPFGLKVSKTCCVKKP